jgi:hypothetical protein
MTSAADDRRLLTKVEHARHASGMSASEGKTVLSYQSGRSVALILLTTIDSGSSQEITTMDGRFKNSLCNGFC